MCKITKQCKICNKSFDVGCKEHNRGNALYCSISCGLKNPRTYKTYNKTCINCNNSFETKSSDTKYCSKSCKQKWYRKQQVTTEYATKSLQRILGHLPCELCGWCESTRDVHHITPISEGGQNKLNNVIVVCPNYHRMIHKNLISKDALLNALKLRLYHHPEYYLEQDA